MTLKHIILAIMDRDTLKTVVDNVQLEGIDRRSAEVMRATLSRSHRTTPTLLLGHLSEKQIKAVCEGMDVSSTGRREVLVQRLLAQQDQETSQSHTRKQAKSPARAQSRTNSQQKESKTMSESTPPSKIYEQGDAPLRLPDPPAGMVRVTTTELVWPGKYNEDGTRKEVPRVSLPFQVIETVNESRATREAQKTRGYGLFDTYEGNEGDTFEAGWRNKLIWGENLLVMGSLLEKFAGKIDLIYIDPPFATGADFSFTTLVGDKDLEIQKEQSAIEEKAYRDTWGRGLASYAPMMWDRLRLMKALLGPKGTIAVHVDWRVGYLVKAMLDELFGSDAFINEIIWYYTGAGASPERFSRRHDNIYWYANGSEWYFDPDPLRTDYAAATKERFSHHIGNIRGGHDFGVQELNPKGKHPDDVVKVSIEAPSANERTGYATQKPIALLEKLVAGLAPKGGLVADFFVGSGTTLKACELAGRRWIGCDLGRWGVHVTRKRLLGIEACKPFEVLNLGKYERQYWQGVTFGGTKNKPLTEQAHYSYLAFILKLHGAQPVAGMAHLHGKKGMAMVHIGAVDAPVTISEIDAAVDECARLKQGELHVLGWEWEMGLYDLMVEAAKKKGVKLLLLIIPREVMERQDAAKDKVRFFELAYLEAEIKRTKKLTAQVALRDFVIPNTDLIPEEVRSKIKKWSDFIDYWAVDWDFQNDTFMQGWVAYRTRKERTLPLACDPHTYEKSGKYRILVKVIDIFGNDTSQAFDVEVK